MKDGHRYQVQGRSIDGTVYWTKRGWMTQTHPRIRLWMKAERAAAVMDAQRELNKGCDADSIIGKLCIQ